MCGASCNGEATDLSTTLQNGLFRTVRKSSGPFIGICSPKPANLNPVGEFC